MKRSIINTLIGLSLTTAATAAFAGEWKFLPVRDADYKPELTISIAAGSLDPAHVNSGTYTGIELALNCLALQPPSGAIRTKISLGTFDHNGLKLTDLEINPRWTTKVAENLTFGIGPGVGYVTAKVGGKETNMAALQIGADLDYRLDAINLGVSARWQDTRNKDIAPGLSGVDNNLILAKVGYNF